MRRLLPLLAATLAPVAAAQPAGVRVALTCQQTYCDADFQRTELSYVSFVREPGDADVQALVTSDDNGGGGETYTVRLIGRGRFEGRSDTFTVPFAAAATDDARRRALARTLAAGLMPYLALAGGLDRVTIAARAGIAPSTGDGAAAPPPVDPWKRWVFSVTGAANLNGDENRTSVNSRVYASASRVTGETIARLSASANENLGRIEVRGRSGRDSTIRNEQRSANARFLLARSLGARTTAGVRVGVSTSVFNNEDLGAIAEVGIEQSLFPYAQSTERLATVRYGLAAQYADYADTTVFGQTHEVLLAQKARLGVNLRQPWGTVFLAVSGSHLLNHPEMYSVSPAVSVDVKVATGLSIGFFGVLDITRDQRQISAQGISRDDVLLQRRALQSGYNYFGGLGMRYTFGSKLAGIVNNRFQDGYSISFNY